MKLQVRYAALFNIYQQSSPMLQRSLRRSLQRQWSPIHQPAAHVCACKCGRQFSNPIDTHRRQYATRRMSPAASDRRDRMKRRALTPQEARQERERDVKKHDLYYEDLNMMYNQQIISITPDAAIDFLNRFNSLAKQAKGQPTVDPDAFMQLVEERSISLEDCRTLSRDLLVIWAFMPDRYLLGKRLMLTCSRVGHEEATISVMGHAVLQNIKKPGTLKSKEIRYARDHLERMVQSGHHYRAQVLAGRIAEVNGDEDRAIKLWTNAMASAVEASASAERFRRAGLLRESPYLRDDNFELTSPWIDLFHIHRKRGEANQAKWALEIGCQQDDPDAHYLFADYACLQYHDYDRAIPEHTSKWLYHMTKAASSGHQKASYHLGEYYAQSSWKYVEDEPPDDIKPTPFDSYPTPHTTRVWSMILAFLGIKRLETLKHGQMFYHALFPFNAVDRIRLALEWIHMATLYAYAPASLLRAKIHMQKTINSYKSSPRTAPKSALTLQDSRYTFASKADYDAYQLDQDPTHRISPPPDPEDDELIIGPPNPFYSPELARHFLRDIFYAHQAHGQIGEAYKQYARERRQGLVREATNEDEVISEKSFQHAPWHIRKWFRHPEVREQYEDKIEDLLAEAKELCDAEEWDLFDDDGGLVYRAKKSGGGKG